MGLLHYLIAVVCQWLSDACQNEQFLALHDRCWGKRVNQHRSVAASHTTHTEKLKLIYTERLRLSSTSTISQYWAYQPCVRVTQQKQQSARHRAGLRQHDGRGGDGQRCGACGSYWKSWWGVWGPPEIQRGSSRYCSPISAEQTPAACQGRCWLENKKEKKKKESKHHLRYHEAGLLQATHVGFFVVVIFVVEKHHSHTPDF